MFVTAQKEPACVSEVKNISVDLQLEFYFS